MWKEFRTFIARGNVLDLAVGVIIGAAFGKIVSSLTDDIIMPAIGALFGKLDFSSFFVRLGPIPADFKGSAASYAELKSAGVAVIGYGQFATAVVNFLLVAFVIFLIVRMVKRALPDKDVPQPSEPADVALLRDIRDELRKQNGASPAPVTSN